MATAESQSLRCQSIEAQVVESNTKSQEGGRLHAFIICFISLSGGFALLFFGGQVSGLVSIIPILTPTASVFGYGRDKPAKERQDKQSALISHKSR